MQGYKAQSEMVLESLDKLIGAYEGRKESLVVEGVHLSLNSVVRLMQRHPSILPFLIHISNEAKHRERFAVTLSIHPGTFHLACMQSEQHSTACGVLRSWYATVRHAGKGFERPLIQVMPVCSNLCCWYGGTASGIMLYSNMLSHADNFVINCTSGLCPCCVSGKSFDPLCC